MGGEVLYLFRAAPGALLSDPVLVLGIAVYDVEEVLSICLYVVDGAGEDLSCLCVCVLNLVVVLRPDRGIPG
jgi:hypothetical protein